MTESSLETQIDCFLEQFKRNASKAMEERNNISRSRSSGSGFDTEPPDELAPFEEIEMVNTVNNTEPLQLSDVADLLNSQYAIISGGKTKDGCPIITFPDNNNFNSITDSDYQRLMLYLTSVPSLQEADLGFHLIIDRRKDRWNSVKNVLLKISVYFPGLIHIVYVLRPSSFLQKALSEVSNKLFKDEFKFRMVVLSTIDELHELIDIDQLTIDLGGTLIYSHNEWMEQRNDLEKFSQITKQVSNALDKFTKSIDETELPNNADTTQQLLNQQTLIYTELKDEILSAAKHGEYLLSTIKNKSITTAQNDKLINRIDTNGNVFVIERLLVQLEETERTFDEFWQQHSSKLRNCLDLRRFEQDFRELQTNFNSHIKTLNDMKEIGDNSTRIEQLYKDILLFEKLCYVDIERSEEVVSSGEILMQNKTFLPLQCIEPKCCELIRMRDCLIQRLTKRKDILIEYKQFLDEINKANEWCEICNGLLTSQSIENCSDSLDLTKNYLDEIQQFKETKREFNLEKLQEFKIAFQDHMNNELKQQITQTLQRISDIGVIYESRIATLTKLATTSLMQSQSIITKTLQSEQQSMEKQVDSIQTNQVNSENDYISNVKTGHVLTELIETERVYVSELLSIINGYKMKTKSEEMQCYLTSNLIEQMDVIFGNLEEIYQFHANIFLKDLENCITSIDLVALCFVQRRDTFFRLYSYYCQNIPRSEHIRESFVGKTGYFQACQKILGHKLPLGAYLLKPVQRITKYQLLLKDLLRYSNESKCCKELQQALDCMLIVLKCVNDSMHQISITGFAIDLSQQGDLLLQGSFNLWADNKRDLRLRLKPMRRHIFLYQKCMLFCKPASKSQYNKVTYQFKHYLKMSQIGLTETVKGDDRKFEIWLQGRQEVYTIQASNIEQKQAWVNEIKRVLLNQLEELKGEKIKQYSAHRSLRQTTSWEKQKTTPTKGALNDNHRTMSCDVDSHHLYDDNIDVEGENWSSECSNSDDDDVKSNSAIPSGRYIALSDYCAVGNSEVNLREGDIVELLKVGCAGWWFVKIIGTSIEGWAPEAYLENLPRKASRSGSKSHDKLSDY